MTHATLLWLGQAIGAAALSILQAATAGSLALTNLIWDSSQGTPTEYVGAQQTVQHLAGGYNFLTNGTQTGIVLQSAGTTQLQTYTTPCTATGGVNNYAFCYVPSPFTSSGTLTQVSLDCAGVALGSLASSGAIVKQLNRTVAATATNLPNFTTKTISSGSHIAFLTGSILVNPKDAIRFQERTSIPTTTNINCNVRTSWYLPKGL